jgi:SAM-dependent methyltransferase
VAAVKAIDRWLQQWRIAEASRHIPREASVLDIGCADGALFRALGDRISYGVGVDPEAIEGPIGPRATLYRGHFPAALPDSRPFHVICLLAVLEHIPEQGQRELTVECAKRLAPGGRVIVTVPAPAVDHVLDALRACRLIDGMSLEQHYGFDPADLPTRFAADGLRLTRHSRFQLGLNHLFVFNRAE